MTFDIYKSQYNPANLTGICGGAISTSTLSGYIGELFYEVTSPPSGSTPLHQYRKVFIKNTSSSTSTGTKVWIDSAEHPEQIYLANSASLNDTTSTPTGQPASVTSWSSPATYASGLSIGTLTSNGYTGIWLRETLSGISNPDPYATFRLFVGGIIS